MAIRARVNPPPTTTPPTIPAIPAIPTIPAIPSIPAIPAIPTIPTIPSIPTIPAIPAIPTSTTVPTIPSIPTSTTVPTIPTIPTSTTVPTSTSTSASTIVLPSIPNMNNNIECNNASPIIYNIFHIFMFVIAIFLAMRCNKGFSFGSFLVACICPYIYIFYIIVTEYNTNLCNILPMIIPGPVKTMSPAIVQNIKNINKI